MNGGSVGSWIGRALFRVVAGTILIAIVLVAGTAIRVWQFARNDDARPSDIIVVMGAAQYNGVPSQWFAARLDQAADLYKEGIAPTIVTVGGKQSGDAYTEAESGKTYLEQQGVPSSAVVAISEGSDTLTSAEAIENMAKNNQWSSAVVVTDPWHALRARTMLRDQGIKTYSVPTRHGPSVWSRSSQFSGIIHETGGLLYYQATHRSNLLSEETVDNLINSALG